MQFVLGAFFNGQPVKFSANERDVILSLSFSVSLLSLSLSLLYFVTVLSAELNFVLRVDCSSRGLASKKAITIA